MRSARYFAIAGGILTLALLLRIGVAVVWQQRLPAERPFAFDDSETYWVLAQHLVRGEPYAYGEARMFRVPGYPLVLAGLFTLVGDDPSPLLARLLGAALGVVTVAALMCFAQRRFGSVTALVTGLLAALSPGAVATSVLILSEALFCPLMVLQLWLWSVAMATDRPRARWYSAVAAGVCGGLATLTRPSWLLFTPAMALVLVAADTPRDRWRQAGTGGLVVLALVAAMVPWWIRNYHVAGTLVVTTSQVGASLYDGWRPDADGASDMRFVPEFERQQRAADAQGSPAGLFEMRLDRRMRDAALAWARHHPWEVVRLMGVKCVRMWSPWPHAREFQQPIVQYAVAAAYLSLISLVLVGALGWVSLGGVSRSPSTLFCWAPAIYFTLLHSIFIGSVRYREPPMLMLLPLAAMSLIALASGALRRRVPQ